MQWRAQDLTKTRAKSWCSNYSGQNPKATTYNIVYRTIVMWGQSYVRRRRSRDVRRAEERAEHAQLDTRDGQATARG